MPGDQPRLCPRTLRWVADEMGRAHAAASVRAAEACRKWRAKRTPEQRAAEVQRVQRWRERNRERVRASNREAQRRRRLQG